MINTPASPQRQSNADTTFQVIIVGAGMVGGAIACDLAHTGISVGLVEKQLPGALRQAGPPDIRVSSVNLASEDYLRQLKAWSAIKSMRCHPYRRLAVWEDLSASLAQFVPVAFKKTTFDAASFGHSHLGHFIENQVIQLALQEVWDNSSKVTCFPECSIDAIEPGQDLATLTLSNGQQLQCQLVIGADGAESGVRKLTKLGITSSAYQQHALVLTVATKGEPGDTTWQSFTPHGPLAYLPLPEIHGTTYASLVWYDSPARHKELLSLADDQLIQQLHREFPDELPEVQSIIAKASFPLVKRHAHRYWKKRVVLIGDAAHTINPLAGQGLNLGLQDAKALARQLSQAYNNSKDLGSDEYLQAYERARRQANQIMINAMDAFYYIFSNNIAPLKLARNLGLGLANQLSPAKRRVMAYALGLNHQDVVSKTLFASKN